MKYGNKEKFKLEMKSTMKSVWIWIAMALIAVAAAGCVTKPDDLTKNETLTTLVTTTPTTTDLVSSIEHTNTVSPAPKQLYIKAGQHEQFIYRGHNITINYTSAYPTQTVKITLDGYEKTIRKEMTDNPDAIYWSEGKLGFTLKPVVWEIRDGKKLPSYEGTWNTTELYFEVLP